MHQPTPRQVFVITDFVVVIRLTVGFGIRSCPNYQLCARDVWAVEEEEEEGEET